MTAHSLLRFTSQIYNNPQLITEEAFSPILQYLTERNLGEIQAISKSDRNTSPQKKPATKVDRFGEILVDGSLTYKPVETMCGAVGTSYQSIIEQAAELIDSGVSTIVMVHSSPGGEAAHTFATANRLRQMADESGVKLITYIDTISASAALALGVVSDEVIIHEEARTGSIGCVCALKDTSKAMEKMGVKPIFISSTKGKTPFAADGSFTEDFLNKLQEDVTYLGNMFAEHVHKYTSIPVADILALDAQMFRADKALELGLVNKIMNHEEFAAYLATI